MKLPRAIALLLMFAFAGRFLAVAQQAARVSPLAKMPVKEVSIFKDGHAFVLHRGSFPVNSSGNVVLDYLPTPVLGTFWAYTVDGNIGLDAMTAGQHRVVVERTALKLADLLESNIGAEVIITEKAVSTNREGPTYPATIVGVPRRSSAELDATSPPNTAERLPIRGELILLRTNDGVKVVPLDRIQDVVFRSAPKGTVSDEEFRNQLTLRLNWKNRPAAGAAEVGLVYLQKGLRWIPDYRVTIDGKGTANVKLQAGIVNELADLEDTTVNLVVGVPSFAFKDTLDPLAMQQSVQLSNYFQSGDRATLSNALMSQSARPVVSMEQVADLGPIVDSGQNEDLFLFTLQHVSLNKGQRASIPVAEYTLKYKDIYSLDIPYAAPLDLPTNAVGRGSLNSDQQAELARLMNPPRAMHKIRLVNSAKAPLTTAPALILENDRALAQGMVTYTPTGATVDLELTKAVDIQVMKSETETGRSPNATRVNNETVSRVDMSGSLKLTNFRKESVEVEVTREVLGDALEAGNAGRIQKINVLESDRPLWWRFYNWPTWWNQLNGVGRITWRVTIPPGATVDLNYTWRYYWR